MDLAALKVLLGGHLIHQGPFLDGPEPHDWRQEHGEALALLLECSGKGQHFLNSSDSPAKALRHHQSGKQVLGLARHRDDVLVIRKALQVSPEATAMLCASCAARAQPSPPAQPPSASVPRVPAPASYPQPERYCDMSSWHNKPCCARGRRTQCSCEVCIICDEHGTTHYGRHD